MDSWSVILNGSVEVTQKGKQPETMHLGDAFGVKTVPDKICHKGVMKTRVDDCQVRLVPVMFYLNVHQIYGRACPPTSQSAI